jgi:ADP-heptose:LPS heptosyltransferase
MPAGCLRVVSWGGIGDALLLTPALRALKRAGHRRILLFYPKASHRAVFAHNPHLDGLKPATLRAGLREVVRYRRRPHEFRLTNYGQYGPSRFRTRHAAELIADMLEVTLDSTRPELYLTETERRAAATRADGRAIVLHAGATCSANKEWPREHWVSLVRRSGDLRFLQLGTRDEPPIAGAVDLRGRTDLRMAFAIVERAAAFVGIDSSLAHAASAVGTPGVVIFGPSLPQVWGHANLTNLYRPVRCSPCIDVLLGDPCPYDRSCLRGITVAEVEVALRDVLQRGRPACAFGAAASCAPPALAHV